MCMTIYNFYIVYKSKYIIWVAERAPQKLRKLAVDTTAVVVPDTETIVPIHIDNINWAKNTMLLTMATSVPSPLTDDPSFAVPSVSNSNLKKKTIRTITILNKNIHILFT